MEKTKIALKVGDIVKFVNEYPDELGARFKVLEVNEKRALIEYVFNMTIKPTRFVIVEDLELCQD
jgi:hypothetical protein